MRCDVDSFFDNFCGRSANVGNNENKKANTLNENEAASPGSSMDSITPIGNWQGQEKWQQSIIGKCQPFYKIHHNLYILFIYMYTYI